MIYPDYEQTAEDHQCLLIVVKQIGSQISPKIFNQIYERINKLCEISISDAQGMGFERIIRVRYKRSYSADNNDWGDFQAHRKVLGLITVGKSFTDTETESLFETHNSIRDAFVNTLYDSRCFVVNSLTKSSNSSKPRSRENQLNNECAQQSSQSSSSATYTLSSAGDDILDGYDLTEQLPSCPNEPILNDQQLITHVNIDSSESSPSSDETPNAQNGVMPTSIDSSSNTSLTMERVSPLVTSDTITTTMTAANNTDETHETHLPINSNSSLCKSHLTQYVLYNSDQECCDQIETNLNEFISSLFWVLESKRLDRTHEKQDKVPLLIAPFEKKDLIGLDTDTRTFRKRCLGRMRKHIADLSLLAGLPNESLIHYSSAIDQLRAVSDWLWLACALEGQCVASLAILYPHNFRRRHSSGFQRNASLPPGQLTRKMANGNTKVFNKLNVKANSSRSLPNGLDPILSKGLGKSILTPNEIYEKYKEAACQYAKYRNAAILEFECSFKAARVLTFQEKYLYASEFIQNAVFISFNQTNEEQIERLSMISELYANIGYLRKASFYKRFAALKAVSLNLQNPDWERCYYLLLPSLEGYGLTLDPMEYQRRVSDNSIGWPGIHMQLLQELVTTSMKMSNETLAVRHLSFLLHSLFDHLNNSQRKEFSTKLLSLSSRCGEGSPVPLKLHNGIVIPSVNLTKFPTIISFKVQNLAPNLRPIKLKSKNKPNIANASNPPSPFIFTPLQFNRSNPNTPRKFSVTSTALDFKWCEGETSQIVLQCHNYLPIDLSVSHMAIMTDGLVFETNPSTLCFTSDLVSNSVTLSGRPLASGKLEILGYTMHALGVKSVCRLRDLSLAKKMKLPFSYTVEVIPPLPLLDINCSLPKSNHFAINNSANNPNHCTYNAFVSVYAGERRSCNVTINNISSNSELIELINVSIISKLPNSNEKLVEWNEDAINNELPLACGSSLCFDLNISAFGKFLTESSNKQKSILTTNRSATTSVSSTPFSSHHNSPMHTGGTSATKKAQLLGSTTLANFISDLQSSNKSKQNEKLVIANTEQMPSKSLEVMLLFEYSGGPGLTTGYSRHYYLSLNVEIQPSILITYWDVLPSDQTTHCFLVLDIMNATNQEMELHYAVNKEILIESNETCRIPVPIERCPLVDDTDCDYSEEHSSLLSRCRAHLVNQVNLKWFLPTSGNKGEASIAAIPWSDDLLNAILLSPIQLETYLNGEIFRAGNELTFKCGEFISVSISMYNCSGNSLTSISLAIYCYQDNKNSYKNYRSEMKKACSGFDKIFIDEIQAKQSYVHECGFTFMHTGIYQLDIQCSGYNAINETKTKFNNQVIKEIASSQPSSLWKCSPNIEINIE